MSEYAIEVKNLCVNYRRLQKYSIQPQFFSFKRRKTGQFEAVKNVSFTVEKGEILRDCGQEWYGKSTLLKTLAGIFSPDSGTIDTKGHSVSLLSIGVGFQTE